MLNTTVAYLIGETDDPTPPLQPERVGVSEVNQIHRNAPQPQIQERQPAPKDSGLTLDDASTPLILEYLWCRLKRDREQMTTEELKETLEKLYKCADYLANRQRKTKTA